MKAVKQCPRLLNEWHGPGPGSGPGVHHNVVRQCLGVEKHPGPHQYEKKRCPE